jgi:antitoxin component YwqK of YwqJK toxin-antitoxin module
MKKINTLHLIFLFLTFLACTKNDNLVKEYYPDHTIKCIMEVKNGMRNGLTKNFDEKGRLLSTAELVNDKYEGWLINYNPANGKITFKSHYKDDKQNGEVTSYYDQGQLYREMTYVNGRVDSIVKTYWPDGKLQAQVYFKMGMPAIGLEEFDKEGNQVQQPHIVIEENNQLALLNLVTLKIYLSNHKPKVDFYMGDLKEGKYLDPKTFKYNDTNGVVKLEYEVPRNHRIMETITILARTRSDYGNTLVLRRVYNVSLSN